MFEFGVVLTAVAAVMATRWAGSSRWQLRVGGLLSFALGTRIVGLVTASYLFPLLMGQVRAEDPPITLAAEAPDPASSSVVKESDAIQPEPTKKQAAAPAEKLDEQQPIQFATDVKYLTPNRPAWLEMAPSYEGDLLKVAVRAGPYQTVRKCEPDLEREVRTTVAEFVNDHLEAPHASNFIHYSMKDLRSRKIVREQFSEQLETSSVGLMSQVHALLVFDNEFRQELDTRWASIKAKSRLAQTGLGAGVVLLFLGTLFSFLKLDTATKGYYTGRLQFGAAATILVLVAASVLLARWIPWM